MGLNLMEHLLNIEGLRTHFYQELEFLVCIFGFMHEFWTISTINVTCTRFQNHTNMVIDKHGMQTSELVVVVLLLLLVSSFDIFVSTSAHPLLFLDEWFIQIYLNVSLEYCLVHLCF